MNTTKSKQENGCMTHRNVTYFPWPLSDCANSKVYILQCPFDWDSAHGLHLDQVADSGRLSSNEIAVEISHDDELAKELVSKTLFVVELIGEYDHYAMDRSEVLKHMDLIKSHIAPIIEKIIDQQKAAQ